MAARIYCDTRQHAGKHDVKEAWWRAHGIELVPRALPFADYWADGSNVAVDTKRNVQELAMDAGRDHARFVRELERAAAEGYRLVVLTERAGGYRDALDLARWYPDTCRMCRRCDPIAETGRTCRRGKRPLQGATLARIIDTLSKRYGARFEFCGEQDTARRVCELLGVDYGQDREGAGRP